jgi:hypothetical protein
MISIKKYGKAASFALAALLSVRSIESRTFETPLPYMTGYFYPDLSNPRPVGDKNTDLTIMATAQLALYNRYANEAFGCASMSDKHDLAYLFHGKDSFVLSELFEDAKSPADQWKKYVDNVTAYPEYSLEEHGAVLGFAAQAQTCCGERDVRFHLNARLPIKSLEIMNSKGFDTLETNLAGIPASILADTLTFDSTNQTFAARLSYLWNKDIIDFDSDTPNNYYVTNRFVNIAAADATVAIAAPVEITMASILGGKVLHGNTTNIVVANYASGNAPFQINPTTTINVDVLPVELYSTSQNKNLITTTGQISLSTAPAIITKEKATAAIHVAQITDGKEAVAYNISNGRTFDIVGTPGPSAFSQFASKNTDFQTPPVFLVKSDTMPSTISYSKAPQAHVPNSTTGTYADYVFDTTSSVEFVKNDLGYYTKVKVEDGGVNSLSVEDTTAAKPGVLWYTEDYTPLATGLTNGSLGDDVFVVTSLDQDGNPTPASKQIFTAISDQVIQDVNAQAENAILFSNNFLNGYFVNGLDPAAELKPVRLHNWNSFKKQGLGDLDVELGVGSTWLCGDLLTDLLLGVVVPTGSMIDQSKNYLAMPLGNNGHYEVRAGLQGTYDFNDWASLSAYGSYSWGLPAYEDLIPSFKGATAFGLIPSLTKAEVSWQQLLINADIMMYPYYCCGVDFGYQFLWKREDKFCKCSVTTNNGIDYQQTIDFDVMKPYSKRIAHKLKMSLFCDASDSCQLSMGLTQVIGGKNVAIEKDYFISLMVVFD